MSETPDLLDRLTPAKRELARWRLQQLKRQAGDSAAVGARIARVDREGDLPLSFAQQRLWFIARMEGASARYNEFGGKIIDGPLDVAALDRALASMVHRHEILRTVFPEVDGAPVQRILPEATLPLARHDLQSVAPSLQDAEVRRLAEAEAALPFDLVRGPLARFTLLTLSPGRHVLFVSMHHVVCDRWSTAVFVREVSRLYAAFHAGLPSPLSSPPIQYGDYAAWQRAHSETPESARELREWTEALAGAPRVLDLPADRPRRREQSAGGAAVPFTVGAPLVSALKRLSLESGVTLFMTLHAALVTLLHRYTGATDLVIGSPVANRGLSEVEDIIGFFVNTLPLRAQCNPRQSFASLMAQVRDSDAAAFARQDTPLERIVQELHPERTLSHSPLFQVLFAFQNTPVEEPRFAGLTLTTLCSDGVSAKFDLTVALAEEHGGLTGAFEYCTDLFDRDRIERMCDHFRELLAAVVAHPEAALSELPIVGVSERTRLREWSRTGEAGALVPFHRLFTACAAAAPDALAVQFGGESLSYAELDGCSDRLARHLHARGIGSGALIGLCVDRSLDLVVSLLAILKSGGAYLPLDPAYPASRLAFMLEDSRAALVLGTRASLAALPAHRAAVLALEDVSDPGAVRPPYVDVGPRDRAYVIYTSGSTGQPKGVEVEHAGLSNLVQAQVRAFDVTRGSRVLQFASLNFDASISEIGMALSTGATLVLAHPDSLGPGDDLRRTLQSERISHVTLPPSALAVMNDGLTDLRVLIVAGEACPEDVAVRWIHGRRLLNAYGPTETSVCATIGEYGGHGKPMIGAPMDGMRVFIVDPSMNLVPIGVPGELCIGGAGVARGYLGRPELTAEKFVPDPFSGVPDGRLYRSGDLARLRADGQIEYLGRADRQVKVRGFRAELEEIERVLDAHPAVRQSVVDVWERDGDRRIAAYVIAPDGHVDPADLRAFLSARLPEYMVPSFFVRLAEFPLTPNRKIDCARLPRPDSTVAAAGPERDGIEEVVADVWRTVLGVARVGLRENFFESGGHSLLAVQLLSRVARTWNVEIGLREFFGAPTIEAVSSLVRERLRDVSSEPPPPIARVSRDRAIPLTFPQRRLWFLDQLEGPNATYNICAALRLQGDIDVAALGFCVDEIVRRHESLRTTFPTVNGVPQQRVAPETIGVLVYEALAVTERAFRLDEMHRLADAAAEIPFDLSAGPLVRARLVHFSHDDHLLLVTMHHIVSDGWSMGVWIRELSTLYDAFLEGRSSPLHELPIQYADFAVWQQQRLQDRGVARELDFWKAQLADVPALLELPTDRPRPPVAGSHGFIERLDLDPALTSRLRDLGSRESATLFMTLMAAFVGVLARYSGQRDIVIGSGMANRNLPDTESLIGFFVNTLVLRTDLSGDPTFVELLARVRKVALDAYVHHDVPFERLVEELQPERSLSHTPLFQVMFAMQNTPGETLDLPGLDVSVLEPDAVSAKFDLTVFLGDKHGGITVSVVYRSDLFDGSTIQRLLRHYRQLLTAAAATPGRHLSELPIMDAAEAASVVRTFAATPSERVHRSTHEWFEAAVDRYPERIAVSGDGQMMTYRELNRRANRLARQLRDLGVGPDVLVGLFVNRSPELLVGLLAILKAGGAYVPLDPSYPAERIAFIVEDSGIDVVVTEHALVDRMPARVSTCEVDGDVFAEYSDANLSVAVTADHLCYVIYTSGSTGRPKGALIQHRNVTRLFESTDAWFHFDERDVWTLFHSAAFDFSVWEMWGALLYGGRLVIVPFIVSRSPSEFYRLIERERVTVLNQTPSAFYQLMGAEQEILKRSCALDALRYVVFGGEALDVRLLRPWFERHGDRPQLVNMYGITETTVHVTWRPLTLADVESPRSVIGVPIPDLSLYVLDERMQPVPLGVAGELYVGGAGLARGYLNRPELTAQRFVPNPYPDSSGAGQEARLYRTGDVARLLPGPDIEYLGRADEQVKIRGFRIEPGEIESALKAHGAVQDAIVVLREDASGDKRLVGYVVPGGARGRPLNRLLRWQREGGPAADVFFQMPDGTTVAHLNRMETEFVYHEIFEERSYLKHGITLPDEAVVFDVGANIGLFALFVARACRRPRVYSFEPMPDTFERLRINVELHGIDARLFPYGLASEERVETFSFYPNVSIISGRYGDVAAEKRAVRSFLMTQDGGTAAADVMEELLDERLVSRLIPCRLRPLSDVIYEEGIERIDLLKIDVEKSELDVLNGIRDEHWARIQQVIVEVHAEDGRLETVTGLLSDKGFTLVVDRDALLEDSVLRNVYAVRSSHAGRAAVPSAGAAVEEWSSTGPLVRELKSQLERTLPPYMVPASLVLLDRFPLTVHGKIDRRALPDPHQAVEVESRYEAPRDEVEARLAAIVAEVLRLPRVSIEANFFDAGGHSLLATQVISRVREVFSVELPLQVFFQAPTIEAVAAVVRDGLARAVEPAAAIVRRSGDGPSVLSFAQERLWFLDQLEPGNPFYNVPVALEVTGALDLGALERSVAEILRRHEVLRAAFRGADGKPAQLVRPIEDCRIPLRERLIDLTALSLEDARRRVTTLAAEEAKRPFDLSADLLFRVTAIRVEPARTVLLFTMHHIVSDGWSLSVLVREMGALYEAFVRGKPSPLTPPPIQYADFAAWQRAWLSGATLERQLDYWKRQLAGAPPVLELPTDRQRQAVQSFDGRNLDFEIPSDLVSRLRVLSRSADATLFMTLFAAFTTLLHRYSAQDDIVVGSPIANRTRQEVEPLIGFFVNTLALRTDLRGDPSFLDLIGRVRRTALDAYSHQDLPFERLVDEIQPERDLSLNPLFQVMFALQNAPIEPLELTGLRVVPLDVPATSALFDLVLDMWETGGTLTGNLQFNTDLFDAATMVRFAGHYARLLESAAARPDLPLSQLALLTEVETHQLLDEWAGPRIEYPVDRPIDELFEQTAHTRPQAVAIRHNGRELTFAALDARASQIAHALREAGVGPNDFVAILDRRGVDVLAAMLGILKAGGAFVPVDPDYPQERIRFMLADSRARIVVTRSTWLPLLEAGGELVQAPLALRLDTGELDSQLTGHVLRHHGSRDLAYMLYTSGSTGVPKGAMIRHDGASNHIFGEFDRLAFHSGTAFLQSAPSSSDISVWQFLAPGLIGARTVIADYEVVADPARLFRLIADERITLVELVPVVMKGLLDYVADLPDAERNLPALEWAMATGETVPVALANQWTRTYPRVPLVNAYGPTEAADDVSQYVMAGPLGAEARTVPVGTPLPNLRMYVLDRHLSLVPCGVAGELCVSGIGVGAGYWNDEARTRAAFVPNPYGRNPADSVLYRTGDLGRWRSDGTLECLDRVDRQVKLRGFRIELGEIEGALSRHPAVSMSAVTVVQDDSGEKRLVAYVVADLAAPESRRDMESLVGEQINLWRTLHEDSYSDTLLRQDDPTFNVIGWDSNYTNTPLPEADMREYVDFTVERILSLGPKRVLEIGCGTGLILFRLVPYCDEYCGTDLSQVAIRQLRELQNRPDIRCRVAGVDKAVLLQQRADDVTGLTERRIDTVVLPSVVQYFPSIAYLVEVIDGLLRTIEPGGSIFVGDVRSLPLLPAFHLSVQLAKSPASLGVDRLSERVAEQLGREQELAIDPAFFTTLALRFPQISRVEVLPKRGVQQNEMTRFRYDVLIWTAPVEEALPIRSDEWSGEWSIDRIRETVRTRTNEAWALRNVRNLRLSAELDAQERMATARVAHIGAIREAVAASPTVGLEPEDLWALESELSCQVHLSVAVDRADGAFDAIFVPDAVSASGRTVAVALQTVPLVTRPLAEYANNPLEEKTRRQLTVSLREFLRARMPQYMVPSDVVFLRALPLTPAGKVDRTALPKPPAVAEAAAHEYVAPRTKDEETLCRIWAEVLGVDRVGIRTNFFEMGGHSLKATQVISRIRRDLDVEIPLRELFASPTVEELALKARTAATPTHHGIPRVADADDYPLSHAQRRLWVLCRMDEGSTAYNMPGAVLLEGALDLDALQGALDRLVARHESLRTAFVVVDGAPRQRILPSVSRELVVRDLTGETSPDAAARTLALEDARAPFALADGGLLRASLLRLAADRHVLLFNTHHIVSDDWSGSVLVREFMQLYAAAVRRTPAALPPLAIQYRDYAAWQHALLAGDGMAPHREYWLKKLAGDMPALDIPADFPRPPVKTYSGKACPVAFTREESERVTALARAQNVSLFMFLVAAVKALLFRYTGQRDIIVGFPIAGRTETELEHQIGFFINMLPLRDAIDPESSFEGLLQQVKRTANDAYQHQTYPFDRMVNDLDLNRDVSRTPLFDVVVVLQNASAPALELPGLTVKPFVLDYGFSKFDLSFTFEERDGCLSGDIIYNPDLFGEARIARAAAHLGELVRSIVSDVRRPIAELAFLADAERRQLLEEWSGASAKPREFPRFASDSIVTLFERAAETHASDVALTMARGGEESSPRTELTYGELNARANRLAHRLKGAGVVPDTLVGLCVDRSVDMVVAIVAILKAGGAYLPLDPTYPVERLVFMIEDAGPGVVITEEKFVQAVGGRAGVTICLDADGDSIEKESDANPPLSAGGANLAYVIYTSGSTGRPKGVQVTHENVRRLFAATDHWFRFSDTDVWTLFHSYAFDFSVWEIWGALLVGGRLVIVPQTISRSPDAFHGVLLAEGVTVLNQTPSAFRPLMAAALDARTVGALRCVVFGGEALDVQSLRPWFDAFGDRKPRLVNMYGITETTVHVTYRPLSVADLDRPASVIGAPIPDLRLFILDERGEVLPIGVPGEMYVGGAGVARGYLNRDELTAERFVDRIACRMDPAGPPQRLYRTGDLARFLDDGDVEYLGRVDQQVKIRGFRIELGEIEAALSGHPGVAEVAVVAHRRNDGSNQLVAYLVPVDGAPDVTDLRAHLERVLPEYMVPAAFVALPSLPLTANGKLDRAALPDPADARLASAGFVEPGDGIEQAIAGVLRDVLRVERLGVHDNFFDLGADSLLLAVAHGRIRQAIGRDLSLVSLYKHPTVRTLAAALTPSAPPPASDQKSAIDVRADRQRQARASRKKR